MLRSSSGWKHFHADEDWCIQSKLASHDWEPLLFIQGWHIHTQFPSITSSKPVGLFVCLQLSCVQFKYYILYIVAMMAALSTGVATMSSLAQTSACRPANQLRMAAMQENSWMDRRVHGLAGILDMKYQTYCVIFYWPEVLIFNSAQLCLAS